MAGPSSAPAGLQSSAAKALYTAYTAYYEAVMANKKPWPPPPPPPPPRPCLTSNGSRAVGTPVSFSIVMLDPGITQCAHEPNGSLTVWHGKVCDAHGAISWSDFETPSEQPQLLRCGWNCTAAEAAWCGQGCGMGAVAATKAPELPASLCLAE